MNSIIVKSIIENSNKMSDFRDYEDDFSKFLMSCNVSNNLEILITELENYKNKKLQFTSFLTLNLVLHYTGRLTENFQERLYHLFKQILSESKDYNFIQSLFFSISNLPICKKYKDFPLTSWREKFEEIEDQLFEYEKKEKIIQIDQLSGDGKKSLSK